jgi:hypothetical protein
LRRKGGERENTYLTSHYPYKYFRGVLMTSERELETIEELAEEAEYLLEGDYEKKDLKEKRGVMKETLYDGSKKLKHIIPKGKQV